jgi:hypothetical protein
MSKLARFVVLVTALTSLFAVLSSTAGAVTWHNTGNTSFTATAGPGTLSATAASLSCTSADASGTAPASFVGATYVVTGTIGFTGCTISGSATNVECSYKLTGISQPTPGITTGGADVTCGVYLIGQEICHISGSVHGHYVNPNPPTAGRLTVTAGLGLRLSNGPTGSCPLGNGDAGSLTHLAFNVTSGTGGTGTLGPIITRTA